MVRGDKFYSTGSISVNLISGRAYLMVVAWEGTISFYDNGNNHPVDVGFGNSVSGYMGNTSIPEDLNNPSPFDLIYNQQIKFVE